MFLAGCFGVAVPGRRRSAGNARQGQGLGLHCSISKACRGWLALLTGGPCPIANRAIHAFGWQWTSRSPPSLRFCGLGSAIAAIAAIAARPTPSTPGPLHSNPPCHLRFPLPGLLAPLPTFDTPQPHGPFPSRSTSIGSLRSLALSALVLLSLLVQSFIDFSACVLLGATSTSHRRYRLRNISAACAAAVCNVRAFVPGPGPGPGSVC
jgi:hypothetical protein